MKRTLVTLLCILFLTVLTGCGESWGTKKDLNSTASELLGVVAEELNLNDSESVPDHIILVTYDLVAFADMPTEEFQTWVLEECTGENNEVVIVTKEEEGWKSEEEAYDYLTACGYSREEILNAEWTDFRFYFDEDTSKLSTKETIFFNIVFKSHQNEGFGIAVNCRYKDSKWVVEESNESWRS